MLIKLNINLRDSVTISVERMLFLDGKTLIKIKLFNQNHIEFKARMKTRDSQSRDLCVGL